ncbi:hypothetical protein [Tissierella sp. Yu-01]|uniref:hypothetical protein n=1 Tax=Tissierella sp. Yu-01 TaxID=3035694 RepID=UPI00240D35FD|nr:hypothetical protein [Tissierella sp. Yu-01]WFA09960.1 hypothetical protein P3962_05255 [Tissierella sp. Yu-01]
MGDIAIQTDYERFLKKYKNLKNQIINVLGTKEYLLKHKYYDLKNNYIIKIGILEHELLDTDIRLGLIKRKIELAQIYMKNQGQVNVSMIEARVNYEFEELINFLKSNEYEIKIVKSCSSTRKLSEDEFNELNKYFKNITRLLHPDLNINLTETQKRLWGKAKTAYENNELEYLKIIYKLANDESLNAQKIEDYSLDELQHSINHMEDIIKELLEEIKNIQDNFPFNKEELLNNDYKIKEIQSELRKNIKEGFSVLGILEDHYLLMLNGNTYIN